MPSGRNRGKMQSLMTQFSYDHRKLDSRLAKIRKNTDELAKLLDVMPPKKGDKKEK